VILARDGTDSLAYVTGQDRQVFAYRVDLDTGEVAAVTVNSSNADTADKPHQRTTSRLTRTY
jgi:hypothetical protein